jgi:beta-phosphoglucomutase
VFPTANLPTDDCQLPPSMISAILFDMDGVLIDATEWHFTALNNALQLFGYSISRYQHLADYNGLPTKKKLEMLSLERGLPTYLHGMINRLKQVYTRDEILKNCSPVFEKEYMLSRLARDGYRMAVCSNSIRDSIEMMLQRSGIRECFEFVISNEDVVAPKPDPEIYLQAIRNMNLAPEQVLIVEDAPHGIEAARRSGAHVCEVSGFRDVDYFRIVAAIRAAEGGCSC